MRKFFKILAKYFDDFLNLLDYSLNLIIKLLIILVLGVSFHFLILKTDLIQIERDCTIQSSKKCYDYNANRRLAGYH